MYNLYAFEITNRNMVLKAVILIPFFTKPFITTMKKKSNDSNFNTSIPLWGAGE